MKKILVCLIIGLVIGCYESGETEVETQIIRDTKYVYQDYNFINVPTEVNTITLTNEQVQALNNGEVLYMRVFNPMTSQGKVWTQAATPSFGSDAAYGVCYGNGLYIAVGGYGKIAYSSDGNNWTQATTPSFGTYY
ncbi:MAG: hypothetical protein ACP5E3_00125, partial [Bacteroidales bacterium]